VKDCPIVNVLHLRIKALALIFFWALSLVACGVASPASPTPTVPVATATLPPTETPTPTPSPTPQAPLAILLAPSDADQATVAALQSMLPGLAEKAGLRFDVRPSLAATETGNVRIVVAIPPNPGLATLVATAPRVRFLAVGIQGLQPAANLSVIVSSADRPDQVGFVAGYVAAAITDDWRAGVVTEEDVPAGKAVGLAFRNGVTYFCGLCQPVYPPFPSLGFPVEVDLPASAGPDDWQAAITSLKTWQVGTVFIYPSLADERFLAALAEAEINWIIMGPPGDTLRAHWVASLGAEEPLQAVPDAWAKLLVGEAGALVTLPLGFTAVNPDLFSPGRQRLAETMLADLLAGYIDTGVDPATGESR